jgi:hypothetical protein
MRPLRGGAPAGRPHGRRRQGVAEGRKLVEAGNAAAKTVESNADRRAANMLPIIHEIRRQPRSHQQFYESFI